ncbi:DNA polymerase [Arthrobacter pigmenti]|uniref:Type-4 uracil-DNA glycosylase n=1 Tax=Arthrobacter pigmenti TaxID=271432 RepID=A0A846RGZ3_9MICC|nr:UdgX family uracil-DNA binding protein [Arthrobacter pigmenti]NJC20960.1 DNA polymerase [Arthrobacter pigmenti]
MVDEERPGAQGWVPDSRSLKALADAAPECRGCELYADATQVVFSAGPKSAGLMLVGEQPGDQEDQRGRPFVGPAGRLLAEALTAASIETKSVYLTNAVKHFRFERRGKARIHKTPDVGHITACRPWLEAELQAVRPAVVVCLGATAGRAVLGRPVRVGAERGKLMPDPAELAAKGVLLTTHPSALLRLRDAADRDPAFAQLVADLEVARDAAKG